MGLIVLEEKPCRLDHFDLFLLKENLRWSIERPTAAIQLPAFNQLKQPKPAGQPLKSFRCAGPSTCQDPTLFSVSTRSLFYCHIPTAPHKNPAFCGQSRNRKKKKKPCRLHMRTLRDPHVILMKGSAQTAYRFSQPPLKSTRISCFGSEIHQEPRWKPALRGLLSRSEVRELFPRKQGCTHVAGMCRSLFQGTQKTLWEDQTQLHARLQCAGQLSKLYSLNEGKEYKAFLRSHLWDERQ